MSHLLPKLKFLYYTRSSIPQGIYGMPGVLNTKEVGISAHSFLQKNFQFGHPEGELKTATQKKDISHIVPL